MEPRTKGISLNVLQRLLQQMSKDKIDDFKSTPLIKKFDSLFQRLKSLFDPIDLLFYEEHILKQSNSAFFRMITLFGQITPVTHRHMSQRFIIEIISNVNTLI